MLRSIDCYSKRVLYTLLLTLFLGVLISPNFMIGQCGENLIRNGSLNGQVAVGENADGWTSDGTDPDINSTQELPYSNIVWSQDPIPSQNGGTWQNIATVGEKLQQRVFLVPGQRYLLKFEYTSHGMTRNGIEPLFRELTGVKVTIDNQVFETAIDTTSFTWESTCLSFIAQQEENLLTFEGSVTQGYLGIDGICLSKAEDQVKIDDTSFCLGDELNIELESSLFSEALWNDMTNASEIDITSPGEYWVEITDDCGTYREEFSVAASDCGCKLYIPNCFSPKLNDEDNAFVLATSCELMDFEITIFDRWGNIVYVSTDINESWNGEVGGSRVEGGQYIYKVTYDFLDNERIEFGSVSISY